MPILKALAPYSSQLARKGAELERELAWEAIEIGAKEGEFCNWEEALEYARIYTRGGPEFSPEKIYASFLEVGKPVGAIEKSFELARSARSSYPDTKLPSEEPMKPLLDSASISWEEFRQTIKHPLDRTPPCSLEASRDAVNQLILKLKERLERLRSSKLRSQMRGELIHTICYFWTQANGGGHQDQPYDLLNSLHQVRRNLLLEELAEEVVKGENFQDWPKVRLFLKLMEMGLIERFGKGKSTHYKLKSSF